VIPCIRVITIGNNNNNNSNNNNNNNVSFYIRTKVGQAVLAECN
jgi:hypothetical protein